MWSFIWRDVINQLRAAFRCVALDFRGAGPSRDSGGAGPRAVAPAVSWEGPHGTGAAAISRTWPCHQGNRRPRTVHPRSQQPHDGHRNHLRC